MSKFCLTFDTDWCPQEHIDFVIKLLDQNNLKATFFPTNNFPIIEYEHAEVGIHPDLEYNTETEIKRRIEELLTHYHSYNPIGVRVHRLYNSAPLNLYFSELGLKYQSNYTTYLANTPPFIGLYNMKEFPIYFMDYFLHHFNKNTPKYKNMDTLFHKGSDIKVMCFHPTYIYINTHNMDFLQKNKATHGINNNYYGMRDFFKEFISTLSQDDTCCLKELL